MVQVLPNGMVRVHYIGWRDVFDETVTRDKLWIEPKAKSKEEASEDEPSETELVEGTASSDAEGSSDESEFRTWVDSTGKHKVEAKFLSFEDGQVRLERRDGNAVSMPIKRLSLADQKVVRKMAKDQLKQ